MADEGFTITNLTGDRRRRLALTVLEKKLEFAVHFKYTDAVSLQAARGWADSEFRTTKQALAWVSEQVERYRKVDTAREQAQAYFEYITSQKPDEQFELMFEPIVWAFLEGWLPPTDERRYEPPQE